MHRLYFIQNDDYYDSFYISYNKLTLESLDKKIASTVHLLFKNSIKSHTFGESVDLEPEIRAGIDLIVECLKTKNKNVCAKLREILLDKYPNTSLKFDDLWKKIAPTLYSNQKKYLGLKNNCILKIIADFSARVKDSAVESGASALNKQPHNSP